MNESNMQIIENATRDDVRAGDHVLRETAMTEYGVTRTVRREGIAHRRDSNGDWRTIKGGWLTDGEGEGDTLTIRRHAQELPTASCAVIVPADGCERVEAMANVVWYANEAVLGPDNRWHGVWRADSGLAISSVSPEEITPGTWKVQPMSATTPECECPEAPEHLWTMHYGAVDPVTMIEHNPECPVHRIDPQDGRLPNPWTRALNNPDQEGDA